MALSRADFIGLADSLGLELRHTDDKGEIRGLWAAIHAICVDLKKSNRNFDRERFIDHIDEIADGQRQVTT